MPTISHEYSEADVRDFFDQTLTTYLSFWDSDGVLHTGYFAGPDDEDYQAAAERTSQVLALDAGLDATCRVLDVGCGCGNFLIDLAARTGCGGEGLDLSAERIAFAQSRLADRQRQQPLRIAFRHGSATQMPYPDGTFSQVVSQDALCLVPDKPRSHVEMYRVLRPGGTLAFSDFIQPRPQVSERARQHVYDRVRWNGGYSLPGYQAALEQAGFEVTGVRDLRCHIRQTYRVLGVTARQRAQENPDAAARDWMLAFARSCDEIQVAIDQDEFSWGMFTARKPGGSPS